MGNHNHEVNNVCDMNCGCNMSMANGCACGCGGRHRAHIVRFVLGLVLLIIVFCFGVNIGELRGELRATRHAEYKNHRNMMYEDYGGYDNYYGAPSNQMMDNPYMMQ